MTFLVSLLFLSVTPTQMYNPYACKCLIVDGSSVYELEIIIHESNTNELDVHKMIINILSSYKKQRTEELINKQEIFDYASILYSI